MRTTLALGLLLALAGGCAEKVYVDVRCKTIEGPAIECGLTQKEGKAEVDVCWDFSATCENGAVVRAAHTCAKVKDGGTNKVTIHAESIVGVDKCQGTTPPVAKLENLTINGKPSTAN